MAPKKRNGFYFYMMEIMRNEEEKGVKCTMAAAQEIADRLWQGLSRNEKEMYNQLARSKEKDDLSKKFNTLGVSLAELDRNRQEQTETLNVMTTYIKRTIENLKMNKKLHEHRFFVCHVNYYYRTDDNYYAPAEVAMVVFSFKEGIIDTLHFFVEIGKIPLGYSSAVLEHSQKTHRIPMFEMDWAPTLKDYYEMYLRVMDFIKKYSPDEIPPLYTMCDSLLHNYSHLAVQCAFVNFCEAANKDTSMLRIYHLDQLFYEVLHAHMTTDILSVALARSEIEKDAFSFFHNLGCKFHEEIDASGSCSLSMVKRWVFTVCDHCCKQMRIPLTLGRHVPYDVNVNWKTQQAKSTPVEGKDDSIGQDSGSSKSSGSAFSLYEMGHGRGRGRVQGDGSSGGRLPTSGRRSNILTPH